MTKPPSRPTPLAGGIFIALGAIVGTIGGVILGQPSAGLLIGIGTGAVAAIVIWLAQRGRE